MIVINSKLIWKIMLNQLFSIKTVIITLVFSFSTPSYAQELTCENTRINYQLSPPSSYGYESVTAEVFINDSELPSKLSFEWVHFSIMCFTNIDNDKFIVYKAYCGGSGCDDSSNYGVIDASTGIPLLKPYTGNRTKAKKILKNLPLLLD